MKKKCVFCSLTAAMVMLFASCNTENLPGVETKDATVKITVVSTRGSESTEAGTGDENLITKIEAYTFDGSGTMIDYATSIGPTATLKAETGAVTIVVIANSDIGRYSTGTNPYSLSELKQLLSTHTFDYGECTTVPTGGFVMTGEKMVTLVEGENSETLTVKRTVSKFEKPTFSNDALALDELPDEKKTEVVNALKTLFNDNSFTVAKLGDVSFECSRYALANGLNKSLLFNDADYSGSDWPQVRGVWITPTPSETSLTYLKSVFLPDKSYDIDSLYSGDFINYTSTTPVYVHENFPYPDFSDSQSGSSLIGYNPKEVYCFIIEGKLEWDGKEVSRYWRVNLVKNTSNDPNPDNDFYRIFRNGLYRVNISKIMTIGYDTPKEAEEEKPVITKEDDTSIEIDIIVAPWDVYISDDVQI